MCCERSLTGPTIPPPVVCTALLFSQGVPPALGVTVREPSHSLAGASFGDLPSKPWVRPLMFCTRPGWSFPHPLSLSLPCTFCAGPGANAPESSEAWGTDWGPSSNTELPPLVCVRPAAQLPGSGAAGWQAPPQTGCQGTGPPAQPGQCPCAVPSRPLTSV